MTKRENWHNFQRAANAPFFLLDDSFRGTFTLQKLRQPHTCNLYTFLQVCLYRDGGWEGKRKRKGEKRKVSSFCLQLKEFSSNFSLETGTLLKNLYFHLLAQGKLSHSFLSHGSSLYVFQGKKECPTVCCFFYSRGEKTTKHIAAILPSVSFQEN